MTKINTLFTTIIALSILGISVSALEAHAQGMNGTQDRDRDQERIQDPDTHMDDSEADRDRDRDRVNDSDADRTQTQDRDRIQDPDENGDGPDRDRDRDQDRVQDPDTHMDGSYVGFDRAQNANQLREMMQEKRTELEASVEEENENSDMVRNQNRIREAVHAFLSAEDLVGGIGPRVAELAKEIDQRVENTQRAEEQIRTRSATARFFFGGDKEAAQTLKQDRDKIQDRIREMDRLLEDCNDCEGEVKNTLREQLNNMEQEQERLNRVAEDEMGRRGLFGFLFGWMN